MKTILVPTDLTPLAEGALHVAADIARTYNADILLVHYLPFSIATASTAEGGMEIASYLNEQEMIATEALQNVAENPAYEDILITPIVSRDANGLYETMTEHGADLIVLATHGASGWDEWFFGSNAEHIVRAAHCPVLVVKAGMNHFAPKNAIAAIDVNDALKANWPQYPFWAGGHSLKKFVYVSTPVDTLDSEGVRAWMQELAEEKSIGDYDLNIRYARSVESGILNYADEQEADLIVVFTHGHTGLRHFLNGSVSDDILNHATIPVLVFSING
jgi:nucleotide-binding universal stress UspA family protein